MTLAPSAAFGLVLFGLLMVYAEALRPGLVIPGVLGVMALLSGLYSWSLFHPSPAGIACLAAAAVLFVAEAYVPIHLLAGLLATLFLVSGIATLFSGADRIPILFAAGAGLPFSCLTLWLTTIARQARRNKRPTFD